MPGLSIGLTSRDIGAADTILRRGKEDKANDLSNAYMNEMMKGSKIDVKSPEYNAPAHIAAGAMIHTRNMLDENYKMKVIQRKAAEIDERWKMKAGQVEKVVGRYKQVGDKDELREAARILYNSSANANGEQFKRIMPGGESESGKDQWEIERDDGTTVYRDVLDADGIIKRLIQGTDPKYFRTQAMNTHVKISQFNTAAMESGGEKASNVKDNSDTLTIYPLKDPKTGMPYKMGIRNNGEHVTGDALKGYKTAEEQQKSATLGLTKARTKALAAKGHGNGLSAAAQATNNRWAIDKATKFMEDDEFANGPLSAEEKEAWMPILVKKFSEMGAPSSQQSSQQGDAQGKKTKGLDTKKPPAKVKKTKGLEPPKEKKKQTQTAPPKKEKDNQMTVEEVLKSLPEKLGHTPKGARRAIQEGLGLSDKEMKTVKVNTETIKKTVKDLWETAKKHGEGERIGSKVAKYYKDIYMSLLAQPTSDAINAIGNVKTPFKK